MPVSTSDVERRRIRVSGLVQGVGFRPNVWRLANEEGLSGFVLNDGRGVAIEATGPRAAIDRFCDRLSAEAPPLAKITQIEISSLDLPAVGDKSFVILASREGDIATGIVPDWATCPACLAECFDSDDRRHGYAFTNCTHCGPRLSIVEGIPYDRQTTTMAQFTMCPNCQREYDDPSDRRFHAQPNACATCGPRLWLEDRDGRHEVERPVQAAASLLCSGQIVAVKGLGGFHLACDATCEQAVRKLRERKVRGFKPLAVMVRDVAMARAVAELTPDEADMLRLGSAPIVLVARNSSSVLAGGIAPGQVRIGVMLPYTPLHHLLLAATGRPLVMTSGNLSSEPQCVSNDDAKTRLAPIADAWLMHDRDIANRLDDSVVRIDGQGPSIMRRARGFAPAPVQLAEDFSATPDVLAFGGELKSTFCFTRAGAATVSQHLGDLEEPQTCIDYRKTLDLYRRLYAFNPEIVAIDKHGDYATSTWGAALADELLVPLVRVQHHHAHLAAVLAENRFEIGARSVLGIILDGTGLGDDGTIWGGEFLLGGYRDFQRVGHFEAVGLAGGAAAIREPWRNTYTHLKAAGLAQQAGSINSNTPALGWLCNKPLALIDQMLAKGVNAPLASSTGRLFDAAAGLLDICRDRQSYEGEAAMLLEARATPHMASAAPYPFMIGDGTIAIVSFAPMWPALIDDLTRGVEPGVIAARFHSTLIDALSVATQSLARRFPITTIALSGGVFQNRILLDGVSADLQRLGFHVLRHRHVPANDGGLSLGQAAIAAASLDATR